MVTNSYSQTSPATVIHTTAESDVVRSKSTTNNGTPQKESMGSCSPRPADHPSSVTIRTTTGVPTINNHAESMEISPCCPTWRTVEQTRPTTIYTQLVDSYSCSSSRHLNPATIHAADHSAIGRRTIDSVIPRTESLESTDDELTEIFNRK